MATARKTAAERAAEECALRVALQWRTAQRLAAKGERGPSVGLLALELGQALDRLRTERLRGKAKVRARREVEFLAPGEWVE